MARNILQQAGNLGGRGFKAGLSTMGDFRKFVLRGNVVDLAVGVVIGAAFNGVVQDFVAAFITPLIQWATGSNATDSMNSWYIPLPGTPIHLMVGTFLSSFLSFLIVAAVVYFFVVRPINMLEEGYRRVLKVEDAVLTKTCPFCYNDVPKKATRCGFCTSMLEEAVPTTDARVNVNQKS